MNTFEKRPELDIHGVLETVITQSLVEQLPPNTAPAPWTCTCEAMLWVSRPTAAATAALPASFRGRRALAVVGGMVRYLDTPVGAYDEVFAIVAARGERGPVGSVVFMAVDSPASLVGGRTNWAMPKTLADFTGAPSGSMTATGAAGQSWRVSATARTLGPAVPVKAGGRAVQGTGAGETLASKLTGQMRVKPALIRVETSSAHGLADLLVPGRHVGAVTTGAQFSLGDPRG